MGRVPAVGISSSARYPVWESGAKDPARCAIDAAASAWVGIADAAAAVSWLIAAVVSVANTRSAALSATAWPGPVSRTVRVKACADTVAKEGGEREKSKRRNPRGAEYRCGVRWQVIPLCERIDRHLMRWARRKYKRLERSDRRARAWLKGVHQAAPRLFAHWELRY